MSDDIRRRFDERAPEYDRSEMHRGLAEAVAAFVLRGDGVPSGDSTVDAGGAKGLTRLEGTVLDVGTGTGLLLRALHRREPRLRLVGVDLSPGMLAVARQTLPSAELLGGDAEHLPVASGAVDLVTCVTALHLFGDPAQAVAEWGRVLRPGGRVVTATFTAVDRSKHPSATADHHALFATPERLGEFLRPIGLVPLRHEHWSLADDTVLIAEFGHTADRATD